MDFSRLHTYTPPQCVPENTGYTYALSSSYSSAALDFETEHKLDPVFDSPRMSRRSLRLAAAGFSKSDDARNDTLHDGSYAGNLSLREQMSKQRKSMNKQSGSVRHTPRRNLSSSSIFSQSSFNSHASDTSMVSTVLDESLIREQTEVDHFWGLDDDTDPKGNYTGNGEVAPAEVQTAVINGYTCSDCSMLSERKEVLTAYSASHVPSSRIYSRDRRGTYFYMSKILRLVKHTAASFASLLVHLFQMVLLRLGYEHKGTSSVVELGLHSGFIFAYRLGVNEESICDDCKGKKHLEIHTTDHMQSSWAKRVARTIWHTFSYAVITFHVTPFYLVGRAASSVFRWLRNGWYQLVTLVSLLSTFLVRRCLPNIFKLLLFLIPLLFLLGRCHRHDEEHSKMMLLLQKLQDQVAQMSDRSEVLTLIKNVISQHLKDMKEEEKANFLALHQEHEMRITTLGDLLGKLSAKSEVLDGEEHNHLLSKVKKLELDLSQMKSELLNWQSVKTSCEKIDVIHEKVKSIRLMFFGDRQEDFPESLLQWLASNFVSKSDLQTLLQDLELQILKNITLYMSSTNQKLTSEVVTNAVNNVGVSGITEAQARIIVNNALKLYSQDKTGMVDFALESGGGSILSTRCSETYETKTALISLFGIPLWYFSQSPRVVIQPDMYPGNCWAFKGSQGYLVVRLSMKIYPTAFTLEHIPKALSPTGNITSAPKNFSVYGLEDEYQEEGVLLGHYFYDQGGEPLQMFPVKEKNENVFQIVELRIVSNWGHAEYTCLYRFRVHGKPAE
uniref:Sad1 and UNC84 domain containing 1 n=1 Tax=Nothoprocta perdicaria TaxID=30464 RepID=A0A8C6YVS9_NOTPE